MAWGQWYFSTAWSRRMLSDTTPPGVSSYLPQAKAAVLPGLLLMLWTPPPRIAWHIGPEGTASCPTGAQAWRGSPRYAWG